MMLVPLVWKWVIPFSSAVGGSGPWCLCVPKDGLQWPYFSVIKMLGENRGIWGLQSCGVQISYFSFVSRGYERNKENQKGRIEAVCAKSWIEILHSTLVKWKRLTLTHVQRDFPLPGAGVKEIPEISVFPWESSALLSLQAASDLTAGTYLRRVASLGGGWCSFIINFPAACLVPMMLIGEGGTLFNGANTACHNKASGWHLWKC